MYACGETQMMQRFNVSEDMLPHVIAVDASGVQVRMYVALRA